MHFINREIRWAIRCGDESQSWYHAENFNRGEVLLFKTRCEARLAAATAQNLGMKIWKVVRVERYIKDI